MSERARTSGAYDSRAVIRQVNADLGGVTPLQSVVKRRYRDVVRAIRIEADREPRS
jgi:hypothetical protein